VQSIKRFFQYKLPDLIWHNTYGRQMAEAGYRLGRMGALTFEALREEMKKDRLTVVRREHGH
jgi:hypothetical protein